MISRRAQLVVKVGDAIDWLRFCDEEVTAASTLSPAWQYAVQERQGAIADLMTAYDDLKKYLAEEVLLN